MGLSGIYNAPLPEEVGISIIKEAYSKGITFFDTADVYGPHVGIFQNSNTHNLRGSATCLLHGATGLY
jgi:aryl-alcohol dehydrogenase-like predicted oxidoreductase